MPTYKFHIIFGLLLSALVGYTLYVNKFYDFTIQRLVMITALIFIYSILPDIDISSSKISKMFRIICLVLIIVFLFLNLVKLAIILSIILLILEFVKHRTFIHTLSFGLILSLPLLYIDYTTALFAFLSYFSHLLIDGKIKFI